MPDTTASPEEGLSAPVLIDLEADLTEEARFGFRRLLVSEERVQVLDQSGAKLHDFTIEEIAHARNEPLVSGGRLILTLKSGEEVAAVTYSQTRSQLFSDAARGIEQLAKKEEFTIVLKEEKIRCAKCGRLLPEKDGVCPHCVNRGKTLFRIAQYLGPYKKGAILLAVGSALATILNLVPPLVQRAIIDEAQKTDRNPQSLWIFVLAWALTLITVVGLQIANGRMNTYLATHISADLRAATYRAIEYLQLAYFDRKPVGAIASRVTQDTDRIWGFLVDGMPFFITNGLMVIGVMVFLFSTNWLLAIFVVLPFPIVAFISMKVWKPISSMFFKVSQKWARMHMHLSESLGGIRVVKAFANESHEFNKFNIRNNELRDAALHADQQWTTAFGFMSLFVSAGALINWTVGGYFVFQNKMTIGQLWMVTAYIGQLYGPLQWFAQVNNWFTRAMAGAERIFEIMDMSPEAEINTGLKTEIKGGVTFDAVRFGYDKSNPILKGISFDVKPGEMIGLVGHSGAGKSTTINLISRFYEPNQGRLLIDGVDYRDLDIQSYRSQIGIVLQEPFLFQGSIRENISYGNPSASFEEVMAAAKAANAHDFILTKPEGYDTVVGERGARLSGGEKQRISIARAILHNPKILILDEATSSVDVETEKQIQEALQRLVKGRTTFAIAHRLSTLRNADRLFVLERGKVVEEGTHEELMSKNGVFKKLVDTQSRINEIIGVGTVG